MQSKQNSVCRKRKLPKQNRIRILFLPWKFRFRKRIVFHLVARSLNFPFKKKLRLCSPSSKTTKYDQFGELLSPVRKEYLGRKVKGLKPAASKGFFLAKSLSSCKIMDLAHFMCVGCAMYLLKNTERNYSSGKPTVEPGASGCEARMLSVVLCAPPSPAS